MRPHRDYKGLTFVPLLSPLAQLRRAASPSEAVSVTSVALWLPLSGQLPQHVREDAAVAIGHQFLRRVDTDIGRDGLDGTVLGGCLHRHGAAWLERSAGADQRKDFAAGQAMRA